MTQNEHLHDALTGQHLTFLQSARDTAGEARFLIDIRPARRMDAAMHVLFGIMRLARLRTQRTQK